MSDRMTLGALLQALAQTRPDATVSDFDQAARPEAYAVPMDRRPATMRAPTYAERLRGLLESGARTVTDQPVGRILDILLSGGGVRAMADAQSPPFMMLGEASKPTQKTLAAEVAKRVPNPIKAYHGSPHDFDQFSMEKIGTGEGAQAYGHGLYFAENPRVARDYKRATFDRHVGNHQTGLNDAMIGNEPARFTDFDGNVKRLTSAGAPDDVARTVADYVSVLSESEKPLTSHLVAKALRNQQFATPATRKAADWLKANPDVIRHKGKMYEVNIHADPESFLDWDKPLSQQSEAARKALGADSYRPARLGNGQYGVTRVGPDGSGKIVVGIQADTPEAAMAQMTGEKGYQAKASRWDAGSKADVSNELKQAGIHGIKYLDQGSRAAGEGSRNYVVFDDSLIEILRKYGLLPFAAGLGAAGKDQR